MADHLTAEEHRLLTDDALAAVYRELVAVLARYDIRATFAFVMAFLLDAEGRAAFAEHLRPYGPEDAWMAHVVREQAAHPQGWFVPEAVDAVEAPGGKHEVACHGFSHRSLGDGELSPDGAARELEAAAAVAERRNVALRTMIFPRNRVGNLPALQRAGYWGYRLRKPAGAALPGPLGNLAAELDLFTPAEPKRPPLTDALVEIPHGHFFNWRHGNRRLIPPFVTVRRWIGMLERAAASGGVAHLWLHPHNFITGPGTWAPFESVLAHAARLRDAGRLDIVTQADYCAALKAA